MESDIQKLSRKCEDDIYPSLDILSLTTIDFSKGLRNEAELYVCCAWGIP